MRTVGFSSARSRSAPMPRGNGLAGAGPLRVNAWHRNHWAEPLVWPNTSVRLLRAGHLGEAQLPDRAALPDQLRLSAGFLSRLSAGSNSWLQQLRGALSCSSVP